MFAQPQIKTGTHSITQCFALSVSYRILPHAYRGVLDRHVVRIAIRSRIRYNILSRLFLRFVASLRSRESFAYKYCCTNHQPNIDFPPRDSTDKIDSTFHTVASHPSRKPTVIYLTNPARRLGSFIHIEGRRSQLPHKNTANYE